MRERKHVKFRVDMYEDTKFKIIDMKPERDVIHYIWSRIVILAGKVNLEGDLYLSKSIPYTIETLAIEFNRDVAQVRLALDIFIELQMLELGKNNVYKVKNFVKHQNIKVKEKEISKNKEAEAYNGNLCLNENLKLEIVQEKDKDRYDGRVKNREESSEAATGVKLEDTNKATFVVEDSIVGNSNGDKFQKEGTILIETKKSCKKNKKTTDNLIAINDTYEEFVDEEVIDEEVDGFIEGDRSLGKDESIVLSWSFG
jgi:predicted phage replisome organizer